MPGVLKGRCRGLLILSCLVAGALGAPQFARADSAALQTVVPKQLTVAYRTDDKPVSFIEDGKPAGYIVEFMRDIGKELGLEVSFVSTNFESMVPAVKNQQYDTAAFGVLVTDERKAMVDFTKPVGYGEARLVSRKDAAIEKVQQAGGKTVAVTRGSALIPLINGLAPDVSVREFPNVTASLNALKAGQVDGLFTGLATADKLIHQHEELTGSQMVTSGIAAFPVSKENPELLAAIDDAITKLMKDGTYTKLWTQWNPPLVEIPDDMYAEYPGMPRPEKK